MFITAGDIMMHVGDILSRVENIIHTSEHHGACGGRGGRLPNKGRYGCAARALGILGVNFCPGSRFWEVNFARALCFWQFLTKMCNI